MRIVIAVNSGNFFQFQYIHDLLLRLHKDHTVSLSIISATPATIRRNIIEFIYLVGIINILILQLNLIINRVLKLWGKKKIAGNYVSMAAIATDFGIPHNRFDSVNSESFHKYLNEFSADIIINSCSQIYKGETIELPRLGVMNVHIGKLPEYRSSMPVFWALFNGDNEFFITIHFIDRKIDTGKLIFSQGYPSVSNELFKVASFLNSKCSTVIEKAINCLETSDPQTFGVLAEGKYWPFPSIREIYLFKKKGLKAGRILLLNR